MPVFTLMAPLALHAGHVVLDEYQVALLNTLTLLEQLAGLCDVPDVLVAHDDMLVLLGLLVHFHVRATNTRDHDFHQRGILGHVRHRVLPHLHL